MTHNTLTASDFVVTSMQTDGSYDLSSPSNGHNRVVTKDLLSLDTPISVTCASPYQYIVYYYTANSTNSYIGKTAFKNGNIDDVATDVIASGTSNGAKYCRISLRDGTNTSADLRGRIDEFVGNVIIKKRKW